MSVYFISIPFDGEVVFMKSNSDKLDLVERHLLALGTDMYVLKNENFFLKKTNKHILDLLKGLKILLLEKGLVTKDDFDHAAEFSKALDMLDKQIHEFLDDDVSSFSRLKGH